MTHQGSAVVHQCPPAVECLCTRRSVSAATDAIGAYRFIDGRYESEMPPRDCHVGRWPPRNDKSEAGFILTKACTGRRRCAGRGMPLPYNAQLAASQNYPFSIIHLPRALSRFLQYYPSSPAFAFSVRMRRTLSSMRASVSVPSAAASRRACRAASRSSGIRMRSQPASMASRAASPGV